MKSAVLSSSLHLASTDEKPNHRLCLTGETLWCHFQHSIVTNTPTIYPEVRSTKQLLNSELLSHCAKMGTKNANESFNSTSWRCCPKTEFFNKLSIYTATFGEYGIESRHGLPKCSMCNHQYQLHAKKAAREDITG